MLLSLEAHHFLKMTLHACLLKGQHLWIVERDLDLCNVSSVHCKLFKIASHRIAEGSASRSQVQVPSTIGCCAVEPHAQM